MAADPKPTPTVDGPLPKRIDVPGVHNAFHVADKVFSGSQPEGDEAFVALSKLGIKTVVSVDGSRPDVEAARRHGLHYIHLPFGYDGIPTNRVAELAKAADSHSGGIFVHCHHGFHRGPAAVAVICEATQNWTTNQAIAWMREAGTASDYAGLYRSAAAFQKPTPEQLLGIKDLPERAKTSSFVDAMVRIDGHLSALKMCQNAGWKAPADHPDVAPQHEALMLWEQLRELTRADDTGKRPEDYRVKLGNAQSAADRLRHSLSPSEKEAPDKAFADLSATCSACHKRYRN